MNNGLVQEIIAIFRRKLVRDTLILQLSRSLGAVLGLVTMIVVIRTLGLHEYGRWALVLAMTETWALLNLSGITLSVQTRLGVALGGDADRNEIADLLLQYLIFVLVWAVFSFGILSLIAPSLSHLLYEDDTIGIWSAWLSLRILGNSVYQLVLISIRNHRLMGWVSLLHFLNQLILLAIVAVALSGKAALSSMVYARVVHAWLMMIIAVGIILRFREQKMPKLPSIRELISRIPHVNVFRDWRYGVMNSIDKNMGTLYVKLAVQWVGAVGGELVVAPLNFALNVTERLMFLTTGLFENMSAVIPRLIGTKEYARLWNTLKKVQLTLLGGSVLLNACLYFLFPIIVPLFYGEEMVSAVPLLRWLLINATIITITGVLGPLYRAQRQVRLAAFAKLIALGIASLFAYFLIGEFGALGGVFYIILLYAISGALTARFALAELRRRAYA